MARLASLPILDLCKLIKPPQDSSYQILPPAEALRRRQLCAFLVAEEETLWISALVHPSVFGQERELRCCPDTRTSAETKAIHNLRLQEKR